jgi:hypothetical protein
MRHRFLTSLSVVAVLIAVVSLAAVLVAGRTSLASFVRIAEAAGQGTQSPSGAASTWTPPRTPWGEPDLQGIWNIETITPLERPKEFAGREFLTAEEAAALERQVAQSRVDRPPRAGDPGTYNQFWFDRGTKVVGTRRTSLIVDPPDGRIPWRPDVQQRETARAETRRALLEGRVSHESASDLDTGERCLTDGLTMVPLQGYNMNYQILQTPGYVVIVHEMFHDVRIIPTDGSRHVGQDIRQWLGDARGRWEGDTLVVDTTNFADKANYWWAAAWRASRATLHLVERFRRVDADTIDYQFTMDDPTMFTRPWAAAVPMTTNQAARGVAVGRLYEYACHEGNYSIVNVLSGARAREQARLR